MALFLLLYQPAYFFISCSDNPNDDNSFGFHRLDRPFLCGLHKPQLRFLVLYLFRINCFHSYCHVDNRLLEHSSYLPQNSTINISAMTNIYNDNQQLIVTDKIENSITSHAAGIMSFQLTFERFPLKRILFKIIKRSSEALVKNGFSFCYLLQRSLCLIREF